MTMGMPLGAADKVGMDCECNREPAPAATVTVGAAAVRVGAVTVPTNRAAEADKGRNAKDGGDGKGWVPPPPPVCEANLTLMDISAACNGFKSW